MVGGRHRGILCAVDCAQKEKGPGVESGPLFKGKNGRRERIRTFDPLHPMQVRYQAAPHADEPLIIAGEKLISGLGIQ